MGTRAGAGACVKYHYVLGNVCMASATPSPQATKRTSGVLPNVDATKAGTVPHVRNRCVRRRVAGTVSAWKERVRVLRVGTARHVTRRRTTDTVCAATSVRTTAPSSVGQHFFPWRMRRWEWGRSVFVGCSKKCFTHCLRGEYQPPDSGTPCDSPECKILKRTMLDMEGVFADAEDWFE